MARFKIGDRVYLNNKEAEYSGIKYLGRGTIEDDDITPRVLWDKADGDKRWSLAEGDLTLVTDSLDNLQAGMVLENDNNSIDLIVQGLVGEVVFFIDNDESREANYDSIQELKDNDWHIKQPKPEVTELTHQQIADKFNIPIEQLRIKENL